MFGTNAIAPPRHGTGEALEVHHLFPTFQGEGPFVGYPAVFIRLSGCNLACAFCDTEFESGQLIAVEALCDQVDHRACNSAGQRVRSLVVLTGGEPFRQPISLLCAQLLQRGYRVQIETNGTLFRPIPEEVHIVCSPKAGSHGYAPLRPDLLRRCDALKFLIDARDTAYATVPELGQSTYSIPVYVQPIDRYDPVYNQENLRHTLALAAENGYRVSIQMHKMVGIE